MNSPAQTHAPTSTGSETLADDLRSELIVAGIPSTAFTLTELTKNTTDYLFIKPEFDTDNPTNAFTLARWVWIVTYDNRFTPLVENDSSGYAIKTEHVPNLLSRFEPIETDCHGGMHAYFGDHNLVPKHLSITLEGDYITTPEDENTITVELSIPDTLPDETQTLVRDGWIEATNNPVFTHTEPMTATLSVADANNLVRAYFTQINDASWNRQYDSSNWE